MREPGMQDNSDEPQAPEHHPNTSDREAARVINQALSSGKLKRVPPQLLYGQDTDMNRKRNKQSDLFEVEDDGEDQEIQPPAKRGRKSKDRRVAIRKDSTTIPTAAPEIANHTIDATATQPRTSRRGRPRMAKSPAIVRNQEAGRRLRNRFVESSPAPEKQHQGPKLVVEATASTSPASSPKADHHSIIEEDDADKSEPSGSQYDHGSDAGDGDGGGDDNDEASHRLASQLEKVKIVGGGGKKGANSRGAKMRNGKGSNTDAASQDASPDPQGDIGKGGNAPDPETAPVGDRICGPAASELPGGPRLPMAPRIMSPTGAALDEPGLELFGRSDIWEGILAAKRIIGVSTSQGNQTSGIPDLQTKLVKDMVATIKSACRLYRSTLTDDELSPVETQQVNSRLKEVLASLRHSIGDLSESSCEGQEEKIITDLYAHAVREMVGLLQMALQARSAELRETDNVIALEEIIGIQDDLVILCTKARRWKAEPTSKRPIKRSTKLIRPLAVALRCAFSDELRDRQRDMKRRANQAESMQAHERNTQRAQQKQEKSQRKIEALHQQIYENATQHAELLYRVPRVTQSRRKENVQQPVAGRWSRAQDAALLTVLFSKELGDCSADERYLKALNDPLLQNLRPEHIAERAGYYKHAMKVALKDYGVPAWISGIK
ncbi:MAG: hypothetical protein Q9201_005024 [Fulgogasparrea decipioides]